MSDQASDPRTGRFAQSHAATVAELTKATKTLPPALQRIVSGKRETPPAGVRIEGPVQALPPGIYEYDLSRHDHNQ